MRDSQTSRRSTGTAPTVDAQEVGIVVGQRLVFELRANVLDVRDLGALRDGDAVDAGVIGNAMR